MSRVGTLRHVYLVINIESNTWKNVSSFWREKGFVLCVFVETSPVLGNLDYSFCCGKFIFYMVLQSEMNILHRSCVDLILCNNVCDIIINGFIRVNHLQL